MNEIAIVSSESKEFRFIGELVHESKWNAVLDDEQSRSLALDVYAIEGGGFVSAVGFQSAVATEGASNVVEETDCFDEVEKFFYVFDINEVVASVAGASRVEKEQRTFAAKRLAKEYEKLMFQFLEDCKSQIAIKGYLDRVEDRPVKTSSVWDMFRSK